jgi:hypothetical protein
MRMKLTTGVNFMNIIQQNKLCTLKTLHASICAVDAGRAYYTWAISYMLKMFIKSIAGMNDIKLFSFITDKLECLFQVYIFQPSLMFNMC